MEQKLRGKRKLLDDVVPPLAGATSVRQSKTGATSDLALDVDAREGLGTRALKALASLRRQEYDGAVAVLEEILAAVVKNELRRFDIRFEIQLFSNEAQRHILLVSVAE